MTDLVNKPAHYTHGIETIEVIESWGLGYHLGNAVKYISRARHKGEYAQDLEKARWYVTRELERARHQSPSEPAYKFCTGDWVRCVRPDPQDILIPQARYCVADTCHGTERSFVTLSECPVRWWHADRFELVLA